MFLKVFVVVMKEGLLKLAVDLVMRSCGMKFEVDWCLYIFEI